MTRKLPLARGLSVCGVNGSGMHPRNIFKQSPDFTQLAIKYAEFRRVCKLELSGKVCVDYKNETALRSLTQTLLLEYFQLKVNFAPGSLVPTLPLRLNYILWLEDLLAPQGNYAVKGIDIGCGSSCIYSLLAARKNGWSMVALESSSLNLDYARENISRNGMDNVISLFPQDRNVQIFREYFDSTPITQSEHSVFDFCICNPPFYDSLSETSTTRNPLKRPPPHNCPTGYKEELYCVGGEVKFVETIMEESLIYKHKIRIFTSMLGHKSSLNQLYSLLADHGISNYCTTEFHQGNTTRWGIAWTFCVDMDLTKLQ